MRRPIKRRKVNLADLKYQSEKVGRFVNYVMWDGKKNTARATVHRALEAIREDTGGDPVEVFEAAIRNASPSVEVRSRRVGGANYQVPREVRPDRRLQLSMRWIRDAARAHKGKPFHAALATELMAASKNEGSAIKKKEDTHKMAEANRAFAHFAW